MQRNTSGTRGASSDMQANPAGRRVPSLAVEAAKSPEKITETEQEGMELLSRCLKNFKI